MKKFATFLLLMLLAVSLCVPAIAAEDSPVIESRGVTVPATLVTPDGLDAYPLVVLVHGHGGSRDECFGYPAIAAALAEQGIASLRIDFPGCGDSTEPFTENCLSNMKTDVRTAIAWASEQLPVSSLGIFGYSMGGRIAVELLADGDAFDAVGMLAPAADNACFVNMFGGQEAFDAMYAEAADKGYITFTTMYGQVQDLSKAWFDDLLVNPDMDALLARAAANLGDAPALVIWGADDAVVDPATSAAVAAALNAATVDATGNNHSYSFYSEDAMDIRDAIVNGTASFFAENLK